MKPDADLSVLRVVVIRQGSVRIDGFRAVEAGDSLLRDEKLTVFLKIKKKNNA